MMIGQRKKWRVHIGRDFYSNRWTLSIACGYRPDAPLGVIPWRHWWQWSPNPIRAIRGGKGQIIGFCAFGRCRIWR